MPRSARPNTRTAALLAVVLLGTASGCVRRRLTVRTDPPGALVSVDNQVIGTSPAASSFVYYGTREIRIERDGFQTETIREQFRPPWYQLPPIDFLVETLWPLEVRDERIVDVQLTPKPIPPVEQVVDRADQLRQQARQGVATGAAGAPAAAPPAPFPPQSLPPGGVPYQYSGP